MLHAPHVQAGTRSEVLFPNPGPRVHAESAYLLQPKNKGTHLRLGFSNQSDSKLIAGLERLATL